MKRTRLLLAYIAALSSVNIQLTAFAQGTAFTYQGRLADNGSLPNASYDMKFSLWAAATGGAQIGQTIPTSGALTVPVSGGLFTVTLNSNTEFGASAFDGTDRWLQIEISPTGQNSYTPLSDRQKLTASPYAITAGNGPALWLIPG
jgi:hypothetical protein